MSRACAVVFAASITIAALEIVAPTVAVAQTGQTGQNGVAGSFPGGAPTAGNGGNAGLAGDGSSTGTNGGPGALTSAGAAGGSGGASDSGAGGGGALSQGAGGGGGGAGGAGTTVSATGTTIISTNAIGGNGGNGGDGAAIFTGIFNLGGGGGGGGGGSGLIINGSATGVAVNINSGVTVEGGTGGGGGGANSFSGSTASGDAGHGGNGGNGITVTNGNGATITNNGTIAFGGAGFGGLWDFGLQLGASGSNGVGIVGANLTVINAGVISIAGGNAILFTGGTNSLELRSGFSISGVVSGGGTNTLKLGGTTGTSFDISQLGSTYQNFSLFQKVGTGTWSVTGTSGTTLAWTISTGTLNLVGATATTGALINSATLGIDGTSTLTASGITNNTGGVLTVAQGGSAGGTIDNAGTVTNDGSFNSVVHTNTAGTITNDTTGQWTGNVTSNAAGITNNGVWIGNVVANAGTINNNLTWTGTVTNSATFNNNTNGTVSGLVTSSAGTTTNNGILNGGASVTGGTLTTTGTINGGLTNSATVNAAGAVKDGITNQGAGLFTVTGLLTTNNSFANDGTAQLVVSGGDFTGITTLTNNSTNATGISISAGRTLSATNVTNSAGATIINAGTLTSTNVISNAGTLTNNSGATINGSVANSGTFGNTGTLNNGLTNTAGSSTNGGTINGGATVSGGTLFLTGTGSVVGTVTLSAASGKFDISGITTGATVVTLNGVAGSTVNLGSKTLTITTGSTFDGVFEGSGGNLTLSGGTETLTGTNTYGGATTINGGTLNVAGAITNSNNVTVNGGTLNVTGSVSDPTVNSGGLLTGTGSVGDTTINAGGTFAPGTANVPGTSMTVAGNLAFTSGALYVVYLNPTTASFATATGTATLGGATVNAFYANGSYINKQYTILTAAGGVSGTFGSLVNTNLPSNFKASLSYDSHKAYLNLVLNFTPGPTPPGSSPPDFGSGLNLNQQNVANALVNFFNTTGGIPLVFGSLTPTGLSIVSGPSATASQQTTFDAMSQFMGLLTDPFIAGRGDAGGGLGWGPRWSVWAAGFGGSQKTNGDPVVLGTNDTTSSIYGTAVGADYRFSPNTIAGFALAGGGTSFGVNTLGSGRSDLFQAGTYLRHTNGPAYITGALAYGWQDVTTNRTVMIAGLDQLRAEFNANAYSGRVEGGYRLVAPWVGGVGITPYAAGQFTTFDLPSYMEQAVVGSNQFALAYNSKSVTDSRSELGLRADKSFAVQNGVLTLRGRLAWAHDFDPNRAIAAAFQSLPGASFVVNGAAQRSDSALTTASAEMKWMNGWSAAGTFEGEFSGVTRSYAGKGVVRYQW